jgi:DNA primase catalytic subunit
MRYKNDGRGRLGGRKKGQPNKTTTDLRNFIKCLLEDSTEQIKSDLAELEPKERLAILEKLMSYVIPKMQTISADVTTRAEEDRTEDEIKAELEKLRRLSDGE